MILLRLVRIVVQGSAALALAACADSAPPPSVSPTSLTTAAPTPAPAPSATALATLADAGGHVRVEVKRDTGGLDPASNAAMQAARPHLEHCHPGLAGKIEVRITKQDKATQLHIQPGASLDPTEGHCVLEALSTVDLDEAAGNVGGPAVKPSGFTSLITISW